MKLISIPAVKDGKEKKGFQQIRKDLFLQKNLSI